MSNGKTDIEEELKELRLQAELADMQELAKRQKAEKIALLADIENKLVSKSPRNNTENHLLQVIQNRHQILQDANLWGEKISLKRYADFTYLRMEKPRKLLNRLGAEGYMEDEELRDWFLAHIKWDWGEQLACIVGDTNRGFPLYKLSGEKFVKCSDEPELLDFKRKFTDFWDHQPDPPIDIDWKFFENLYISTRELELFHAIVSSYEAPVGSIVWKAQIEAFNRVLEDKCINAEASRIAQEKSSLSAKEKANLLKTIGLLAVALSGKNSARYTQNHGISANAITTDLLALLDDDTGMKERIIRKRITDGVQLISSYLKEG